MNYFNDVHRQNAYIEKQVGLSACSNQLSAQIFMKSDTKFMLLISTLDLYFHFPHSVTLDRNSTVAVATRYGMEGPGIESH
jgi:hypothetical protein